MGGEEEDWRKDKWGGRRIGEGINGGEGGGLEEG